MEILSNPTFKLKKWKTSPIISIQASSDASRKPHLSNIISKGEKEMLRALMWKLDSKPLDVLYLSPI